MNQTACGGFDKLPTAAQWPVLGWPKLSMGCKASSAALSEEWNLLRNLGGQSSLWCPEPRSLCGPSGAVPWQPHGSAPPRGHRRCCRCRPPGPAFLGKPARLCIPGCAAAGLGSDFQCLGREQGASPTARYTYSPQPCAQTLCSPQLSPLSPLLAAENPLGVPCPSSAQSCFTNPNRKAWLHLYTVFLSSPGMPLTIFMGSGSCLLQCGGFMEQAGL